MNLHVPQEDSKEWDDQQLVVKRWWRLLDGGGVRWVQVTPLGESDVDEVGDLGIVVIVYEEGSLVVVFWRCIGALGV
ncbi:hypothetical protein Tco_0690341 [Tanacetum coccineum]